MMVFGVYAHATKPRKFGVGLVYGYNIDGTYFKDDKNNKFIGQDDYINKTNSEVSTLPVSIQFDEKLLGNYAYTTPLLIIRFAQVEDLPPLLKNTTYSNLISENTYAGETSDFFLKKNQNRIEEFASSNPSYQSEIDSKSNPALSSDYNFYHFSYGQVWGIFLPVGGEHRILSVGAGAGISYTTGDFTVNLCDPYRIKGKLIKGLFGAGDYRKGICENKSALFDSSLSHLSIAVLAEFYVYSYIGDQFEINFLNTRGSASPAILYNKGTNSPALTPMPLIGSADIFSIIYTF